MICNFGDDVIRRDLIVKKNGFKFDSTPSFDCNEKWFQI